MAWKQVSDKEFFEHIGPLDVTVTAEGNYPYKTVFRLRNRKTVGINKGTSYFLTDETDI